MIQWLDKRKRKDRAQPQPVYQSMLWRTHNAIYRARQRRMSDLPLWLRLNERSANRAHMPAASAVEYMTSIWVHLR